MLGREFYTFNAHGDVSQVVSATGEVIRNYDYGVFGNERGADPNDNNPFRYCAEYWDKETDTYYLRNRHFKPSTGRFLMEDPARSGLNWYVYCNNNPIYWVDKSGLDPVPSWAININRGHGSAQDYAMAMSVHQRGTAGAWAGWASRSVSRAINQARFVTGSM